MTKDTQQNKIRTQADLGTGVERPVCREGLCVSVCVCVCAHMFMSGCLLNVCVCLCHCVWPLELKVVVSSETQAEGRYSRVGKCP